LIGAICLICALEFEPKHFYLIGRFPCDEDVSLSEIWGGLKGNQIYSRPCVGWQDGQQQKGDESDVL
jgi:hypothetical protein